MMKMPLSTLLLGGVLGLAGLCDSKAASTSSVSQTDLVSLSGAGGSFAPVFSADGRFLLFLSHANNLVTNDNLAPHLDVFRHDLSNATTTLVSVNSSGRGGGDDDSAFASISSDGRHVVFASAAGNLVSNDTNRGSDIFERDVVAGVTRLLSVNATGTAPGNAASRRPQMSPNYRRFVVFESDASDLVADDTNGLTDIFLRDLQTESTWLVSANAAGTGSGHGKSESPALSPVWGTEPLGALAVAFVSTATDLVPNATNGFAEIYVRSYPPGTTRWASPRVADYFAGFTNGYRCFNPVLSADGNIVAFKASNPGTNLVLVFRHDLASGETTLLTSNGVATAWPALSTYGRFLAYESETNVVLWDALLGTNLLVSVNLAGTGPGNGPAQTPVMTPDGRKVCFLSAATDLVTNVSAGQFQLFLRDLTAGTTHLISVNLEGAASSDLSGVVPTISADGLRVAFDSPDAHLVADDRNQASDVFFRNLDGQTTRLASVRAVSLPGRTAAQASCLAATAHLEPAAIAAYAVSADGRYVVLSSYDNTLVADDTNRQSDIFVRDLVEGVTTLVSREPVRTGQDWAQAAISGDGRYVVFAGRTNGGDGATWGQEVLYWRDLQSDTNRLIAPCFQDAALWGYHPFSLSRDGRWIAFRGLQPSGSAGVSLCDVSAPISQLTSLGEGQRPLISPDSRWVMYANGGSLFAYDRTANTNLLISLGPSGESLNYQRAATFSGDSQSVAFVAATSTSFYTVCVRNLPSRSTTVVCFYCDNPVLSLDGQMVVFQSRSSVTSMVQDIVLKDLQVGATNLISRNFNGTGGGNRSSTAAFLSADGRYVVFASQASNLVPNDTNNAGDIFVRDLLRNTTLLVSMNRLGTGSGNGHSTRPVLGADGRTVLFMSYASDLVEGDFNNQRDVFVLRLPGTDSDHDGLDDEWEAACFGDLSHDGTADSDHDGLTDREEFLAGTDPLNQGSVLRVLRLTSINGGSTTLLWSAVPGRSYRVQYKDSLSATTWSECATAVTATTTTAVYIDNAPNAFGHRFYRVTVAP